MLPLTRVEVPGVCAADELLLQIYASTTSKFVIGIAIIAVIAIITPNAKLNLCIVFELLPTIKDDIEDCYSKYFFSE